MKSAENVSGRWRVKWHGPVRGAYGTDTVDGTLSEALLRAVTYVHLGSRVYVVDTFGGPTVVMGGQDLTVAAESTGVAAVPTVADGTYDRPTLRNMDESTVRDAAIDALEGNADAVGVDIAGGKVVALVAANGMRMHRTTFTIEVEIEGDPSIAQDALAAVLDAGALQDAINGYESDDGEVEVLSAVSR